MNKHIKKLILKIPYIRKVYGFFKRFLPQQAKINQIMVMNQLIMHNSLLCDGFSNFINDLFEVSKIKAINVREIQNSIYHKFLLNQSGLKKVWDVLDEPSQRTWYHILFFWVSTYIFDAKNLYYNVFGPQGFSEQYYDFFKILRTRTGVGKLDAPKYFFASFRQKYCCDDLILPGMVAIDGGAYTGETTKLFSNIVGEKGMIYSFEPTYQSYTELIKRDLPNVQYFQKGPCLLPWYFYHFNGQLHIF